MHLFFFFCHIKLLQIKCNNQLSTKIFIIIIKKKKIEKWVNDIFKKKKKKLFNVPHMILHYTIRKLELRVNII